MSAQQTTPIPHLDMNDGRQIPQLGFGVFQVPPDDTADVVTHALLTGYRSVDTAAAYQNEAGVGQALADSGLSRDEVFITTKLWNSSHGRESAKRACRRSLDRLGLDYVDLYLIHWPVPSRDLYSETWEALIELRDEGLTRSIGVSNFTIENLERIIGETGQVPTVNQVELHPRFGQDELRRFHAQHGILTEAWSPLARGALLDESTLGEIAAHHDRTVSQIILRWHIQLGNVVIPKSVTPARIEENFRLFDFELSDQEMSAVSALDTGERTGPDPDNFALS